LIVVSAGFADPVLSAQAAFRAVLDATARPATVQPLGASVQAPAPLSTGAAALAMTLCDHAVRVWLDADLRASEAVTEWLRFHCGCTVVDAPREAAFAFAGAPAALPPFEDFDLGTADYPDRSTTIVLQVRSLRSGTSLVLTGPGIPGRRTLCAAPLPDDMPARLAINRKYFPRGVDLILVTVNEVAALPRSVRIVSEEN
jgi:alpha-D-ribose 1-methylphosphonate 5-triphosphate synthase subunit PhnH